MAIGPERTAKTQPQTGPYPTKSKPGPKGKTTAPKTAAHPPQDAPRSNLTLADWLVVFEYWDAHKHEKSQGAIVKHFATRREGALIFHQGTLSRKLKQREEMEQRATNYPNALSSKRPRNVTRSDVERALVLWMRSMEQKGETVNGPMLVEKRKRFEQEFKVPDNQCLNGTGWVAPFCKA